MALGLKTYQVPEQPAQVPTASKPKASAPSSPRAESSGDFDEDYVSAGEPVVEDAGSEASWPTESAEASALADVRERGEDTVIASALSKVEEETVKKALPPLEQLTPRIPDQVKESMEELFRAKWTRVVRIKKRQITNP